MTIDTKELRAFLKQNLSLEISVEGDDFYSNRSKRVTIKLKLDSTIVSEDSFSMVDGEPDREPY